MRALPRLRWRHILAGGLAMAVTFAGLVFWEATRALHNATREVREAGNLRVLIGPIAPVTNTFEWISAPASFTAAAVFKDELFVGGASGLFEYDSRGALVKHYRPGQEIPPAPLLRMATGVLKDSKEPELLIATANAGLLVFNGQNFRQIYPEDPELRTITAILPLESGQLLIGTRKRGVLVLDGKTLRAFHPSLAGLNVTDVAGSESDLWIGTQDHGVVHWQAGRAETFSETDGLPDNQVFSIATLNDKTYVGTAVGIAEFDRGRFVRVLAPGFFARTLYASGATLLAGGSTPPHHANTGRAGDPGAPPGAGSMAEINLEPKRLRAPAELGRHHAGFSRGGVGAGTSSIAEVQQIFKVGEALFAVTSGTLYRNESPGSGWRRVLSPEDTLLADRNVSSLAVDGSGRLWVGYFDRGLDRFEPGLRGVIHIEDDNIFCINRILPNTSNGSVAVATANGLVLFDQTGHKQQVLGRADGLLADHVTDAALYGSGMVLATPAGLTFLDSAGPRSLYAFHGLVNNHVYTVAAAGEQVFAGTLGGISILNNENVAANYTVASRGLPHNWISAVVRAGNDWMVGTYGGGIVKLLADGRFEPFDIATAKFEVYPNAMLATEHHVLAGTLGKGLYVYNRSSSRWTVITEGLPSSTVTALASDNGSIYVGTDNGLVRIAEQNLP